MKSLWEPIRTENPQYCYKKLLGKDQSGQFDIWEYDFIPEFGYKKTIILGGSLHGCEITGSTALALFMREVAKCNDRHSSLWYIRNNVRIITIPIQNPWGFNQRPRSRLNSRGVDLARNANYKWDEYKLNANPGEINYKGPFVRSEIEGEYIERVISENREAIAFIDLHNGGPVHDYWLFTSRLHAIDNSAIKRVIDSLKKPGETIGWGWNELPAFYNWAAENFDMHAFALEFPSEKYGKVCSSEELTRAVQWYGNIIISFSLLGKNARQHGSEQPFVVLSSYSKKNTDSAIFLSRDPLAIELITSEFECPRDGILEIDGVVSVETSGHGELTVFPFIRQKNSGFSLEFMEKNFFVRRLLVDQKNTTLLSFTAALPVGNTSTCFGPIRIGIAGGFTGGPARIIDYRSKARFTPSDAGPSVRIFNALSNGSSTNSMTQVFPTIRKESPNVK